MNPINAKMANSNESNVTNSSVSEDEFELLYKLIVQFVGMTLDLAYTPQEFSPEVEVVSSMYRKYREISDDSHREERGIDQMLIHTEVDKMNHVDLHVLTETMKSLTQKVEYYLASDPPAPPTPDK
ncbi:hypothetical protein Lalb_Chr04g0249361 [Lupinus albus]|uniref:Uncharacterized protein n=1 Tax=Lupinus albus TaxID=3870 RepID=A0A6A4QLQ9_LUPAL|nr:hypothetical protein Lalb_Chr04g0249361 [Lupinus albus]